MNKSNDRGGRKRLPPFVVESIRRNRGLVHAIAREMIEALRLEFVEECVHEGDDCIEWAEAHDGVLYHGDERTTVNCYESILPVLRRCAMEAVMRKVSRLRVETLGRICDAGPGHPEGSTRGRYTSLLAVHETGFVDAGWSGHKILLATAATTILACMWDILLGRQRRTLEDQKAA